MPMWMVSGAHFPLAEAQGWVKRIMWANPLTYSISLLNHTVAVPNVTPGAAESLVVTVAFGVGLLLVCGVLAAQKSTRSAT